MKLNLLTPDATTDGKLIFNFVDPDSPSVVITIILESLLTKTAVKAAKTEAIKQAKVIAQDKKDKKLKRDTSLAALVSAGIVAEEIEA